MEWQQLKGFQSVTRLSSVSGAAQATFRTQSAVSQQIKALEQELGQPLFQRLGKKLAGLTPAGEMLAAFCDDLLRGYEELWADLKVMGGPNRGQLSLAAPFTSLYKLLPQVMAVSAAPTPRSS